MTALGGAGRLSTDPLTLAEAHAIAAAIRMAFKNCNGSNYAPSIPLTRLYERVSKLRPGGAGADELACGDQRDGRAEWQSAG
jgi:hypothetical protein